jgi:hypothetical protein
MAEVPTADEIRQLAVEVMETAIGVRVQQELNRQTVEYSGSFPDQLRAQVSTFYSWIPEFFESHLGPEPASFDGRIDHMQQVERALYDHTSHTMPVGVDLQSLEARMEFDHWDGDAAEDARTKFIYPLDDVIKRQSLVAFTLKHSMLANKEVFVRVRQDLRETATQAITALEALDVLCRSGEVLIALTVVSAVATGVGAATALAGAGLATVTTWELAAAASSGLVDLIDAATTPAPPEPPNLKAETVDGVLENMVTAVNMVQQWADQHEQSIANTLRHDLDLMMTAGEAETFVAPVPWTEEFIELADRAANPELDENVRAAAMDEIGPIFERQ